MMIPLMSLVASASATGAALAMCSAKRNAPVRKPGSKSKSSKSAKSSKSKRSSSKSARSGASSRRSSKSRHRKSKSAKDPKKRASGSAEKEGKSQRSKRKSSKSGKSKRSGSSKDKKKKCEASQCDKKKRERSSAVVLPTSNATSKSGKEEKSSKSKTNSNSGEEKILKLVPNDSRYLFAEGQVKPSTLQAIPNKLPFAPTGGVQQVTISNSTKTRKAFKVKTSDNMLYRVNPVFGFVEPGGQLSIDVLRHNGETKTDNLVVITSNATQGQACAKSVFDSDPARELTVIPLVAH